MKSVASEHQIVLPDVVKHICEVHMLAFSHLPNYSSSTGLCLEVHLLKVLELRSPSNTIVDVGGACCPPPCHVNAADTPPPPPPHPWKCVFHQRRAPVMDLELSHSSKHLNLAKSEVSSSRDFIARC